MDVTANIENASFVNGPLDRGEALGKAEQIQRILAQSFPDKIPEDLVQYLAGLPTNVLDQIFDDALEIKSAAEALLLLMSAGSN